MSIERAAVLVISSEMLASVLQLPAGSEVDAVWVDGDQPGVLRLRLRNAGWPYQSGQRLVQTSGVATRDVAGAVVIDWGFPRD